MVNLARKLQIPGASTVVVIGQPSDVDLEIEPECVVLSAAAGAPADAAVIAFVIDSATVDQIAGPAIEAARADRLAWIAYPKSRQLGTDLNRDILARHIMDRGAQPVRAVSINEVWSALRFRPL